MKRDSTVFYRSFYEAIRNLPDAEQLKAFHMIFDYALDGKEPEAAGIAMAMFLMAKPQIDSNNVRYQNGTKGGRPRKNQEPNHNPDVTETKPIENQSETEEKPKDNQTVTNPEPNENVNDNDKKERHLKVSKEKFVPPTVEEVQEYCLKSGYTVDAEKFIDFYVSKGWMVGKNKMKDWKAAVRNWSRGRQQAAPAKVITNRFNNFRQRDYDYDALEQQLLEC